MATRPDKQPTTVVSACMQRNGRPTFALNVVEVTREEAENGIQYYLVEADLLQAGYEEPFVHFPEEDAAAFLHPAVRQFLGLPPAAINTANTTPLEEAPCA
jgi:hypothetical protein